MKLFITLLATSLFVACASTKKTETVAPASTAETKAEAKTTTTAETTKADKKATKAAKKSAVKTEVAEATVSASASEVNCTSAKDARKLAIVAKNSGCELQYTKASETKTIATQIVGDAKCKEVLNTVKGKLTAANFECK